MKLLETINDIFAEPLTNSSDENEPDGAMVFLAGICVAFIICILFFSVFILIFWLSI